MQDQRERIEVCDTKEVHVDVVSKVRDVMPDDNSLYDLSDFFKVLGDSTRVRIMWALDKHEMCVCDLAALLEMTTSAISHQLKSLRDANLVKSRRDGKNIYYSFSDEHVRMVFEMGMDHINEKQEGAR